MQPLGRRSIYVLETIILLAASVGCSSELGESASRNEGVAAAPLTGPLLQYAGDYIRERPAVQVVFWRTASGLTVSAQTKAAAASAVSATVAGSYFDWLKSEYTVPAALSPSQHALVPNAGSYAGQIERTSSLTTIINDLDIRALLVAELANGSLGPPSGSQLVVLVVVPAGVSVRGLSVNASSSDVPYHDNTSGPASIAYMVVRDDASFLANVSAGIVSTVLNPRADATFEAWSSGMNSVPFREAGCFNASFTVPVLDPTGSSILALAPLYSNAQGTCIGPPLQITGATGSPAPASQTQNVAVNAQPSPFTLFAMNRSAATVDLTSDAACSFTPTALPPAAIGRVDCPASSAGRLVTLAAAFGATTYRTGFTMMVACPVGAVFDGATCVMPTFDCDACPCGCNLAGTSCAAPARCNARACANQGGSCDACGLCQL
jgi:hypothetical protein